MQRKHATTQSHSEFILLLFLLLLASLPFPPHLADILCFNFFIRFFKCFFRSERAAIFSSISSFGASMMFSKLKRSWNAGREGVELTGAVTWRASQKQARARERSVETSLRHITANCPPPSQERRSLASTHNLGFVVLVVRHALAHGAHVFLAAQVALQDHLRVDLESERDFLRGRTLGREIQSTTMQKSNGT